MAKDQIVLFFHSIYPRKTGGMEVYNYHLAQELLSDNYNNIIMLTGTKDYVDNKKVFYVNDRLFGITRWGLGYLSILLSCLFSNKIILRDWKSVLIPYTSNFDLNAWPILFFKYLFNFNYSIHCHGGSARNWKYPRLQCFFFHKAFRIAAVSETIIYEYSKRTGCHIDYLPPIVRFNEASIDRSNICAKYHLNTFKKIILYVGSLKTLKSPETLLLAFSSLDIKILEQQNVCLVLAGEGELYPDLRSKYKHNKRIIFLGNVPNHKVHELYKICDIYVICSWFEGTPISLLEAMYNNCCCIGTNVQGIKSIIKDGDNGFLFPKNNNTILTAILLNLLTNPNMVDDIGERANNYFNNHFSIDTHIKQMLEFVDYN